MLLTFAAVRDEKAAVAVPTAATIGFVVVVAVFVALAGWIVQLRRPDPGTSEAGKGINEASRDGLSIAQGLVLLVSFGVLTAVPAAVIVAAVLILNEKGSATPPFTLPVILLVGMVGLLGVLAMTVAVLARFRLVNRDHPLGLPQGSIQAVIALSLILIFAIVGVYLHGSTDDVETKKTLTIQLLTTVSTLVVAVAAFYFGSKTTKEAAGIVAQVAADAVAAGAEKDADGELPDAAPEGEQAIYGTASPVTGLSASDIEDEESTPPLAEEEGEGEAEIETVTAEAPTETTEPEETG